MRKVGVKGTVIYPEKPCKPSTYLLMGVHAS